MFSRIRSFLSRHRRKFIVTGVVIGGAFLLSRYVRKALREWQERETKEFFERTKKQQHYENVERTCNGIALNLSPKVSEAVACLCNTDSLVESLKNGQGNKLVIWEELKYLAFAKITLLVYTSSILMVTLRLQLNLIGGYMFKQSMADNSTEQNTILNEKYLALTMHLLEDGVKSMSGLVLEKVKIVLKERSLKEKLSIQDIIQIFYSIQSAINTDARSPCNNLPSLIIPESTPAELDHREMEMYRNIIEETKELLESDEIISLANSSISRGFSNFVDKLTGYFVVRNESNATQATASSTHDTFFSSNMTETERSLISYLSIPMAKVIPIVSGLVSGRDAKSDIPYTWMQQLVLMDDLKVLGANVYEGFSV